MRIGDDQVVIGIVDDIECGSGLLQILQLEICLEPVGMFRGENSGKVEALDLPQGLQNGLVRGKDQGIVTI